MPSDIDQARAEDEAKLPDPVPHLRFLKLLVAGLAVAMVLGLAAIVTILWLRLNAAPLPDLPASVTLPEGATPAAVTFAQDRLIVLTRGGAVLVYDGSGRLVQNVTLDQP
ncbi:MAG: DUF6476 family protein [Paracoccus sp. (in: a-proteobacteria)]|nr:DUF6476 family protein [Paracoccus sp. (in: a-proteobacteria)]